MGSLQEPENGDQCWGPLCHGIAATPVNSQTQRLPAQDLPKNSTVTVPAWMAEGLMRHAPPPPAEEPPEVDGVWRRGSHSFSDGVVATNRLPMLQWRALHPCAHMWVSLVGYSGIFYSLRERT